MARPRNSLSDKNWLKIEYLRKLKGYDRDEFLAKTGISNSAWYGYSKAFGNITYGKLQNISELLGVDVKELVG